MDQVALPPELQHFLERAVASGRYRDPADAVAAGLRLLQRQEGEREELLASVRAAEAEAERDGYLTADDLTTRVEARLARRRSAAE